jgi:AhpD family alkylhydroperoxidase
MEPRFNMFGNELGAKFAKRFASASTVIANSPLPKSTQELMGLRASQINGCGWCVDIHTKEAAAAGETALAEEGTRLADADQGVSDETWAQVRKHYDDDQIAAMVSLVAMINAANRLAVIVHQKGGSYEPGMFDSMLT